MLISMRTTLVLDDGLLREAKHRAAARDLTVSQVVNEALREAFRQAPHSAPPFSMIIYGSSDRPVTHQPAELAAESEVDDRRVMAR
jgi:hypothetical protein